MSAEKGMSLAGGKKVLVTGAAGFMGANLHRRLLKDGYSVVGLDNFSRGRKDRLESLGSAFAFEKGDVRDGELLKRLSQGCSAIVHLAELKIPRFEGSLETLEVNLEGTEAALQAAAANGCEFILGSTEEVYGKASEDVLLNEESPLVLGQTRINRWSLAASKIMAEQLCYAYSDEQQVPMTILRYFSGYGPYQDTDWHGGPQAAFISAALKDESVQIHGDGLQIRTFTHVDDLIHGTVLALESPLARGEIINLASEDHLSVINLAYLIWRLSGRNRKPRMEFVPYTDFPGHYEDVRCRKADISKARYLLGHEPSRRLEEGLKSTLEWQAGRPSVSQ